MNTTTVNPSRWAVIRSCVAADLDVIREVETFENILKAVTSAETARELLEECRRIIDAIKALGPICTETRAKEVLSDALKEQFNWKDTVQLKRIRGMLSDLASGLSDTSRLKADGLRAFPVFRDVEAFLNRCRTYGIFLVPVGELEDWVADLAAGGPSKKKKAEWANYAANRIREVPPRESDIWDFVRKMGQFQRDAGARMAGYPS